MFRTSSSSLVLHLKMTSGCAQQTIEPEEIDNCSAYCILFEFLGLQEMNSTLSWYNLTYLTLKVHFIVVVMLQVSAVNTKRSSIFRLYLSELFMIHTKNICCIPKWQLNDPPPAATLCVTEVEAEVQLSVHQHRRKANTCHVCVLCVYIELQKTA